MFPIPNFLKKLMNFVCKFAFLTFILASLYMLVSLFTNNMLIYVIVVVLFLVILHWLRKPLELVVQKILLLIDCLTIKQMVIIILGVMIAYRLLMNVLLYTDFSSYSDMAVYTRLANEIVAGFKINEIVLYPHVVYMALFIAIPKMIGIGYSTTMFILFCVGTILYFLTFCRFMGKNNSFLAVVLYIICPSTILFSYLITHEILFYFLLSIVLYLYTELTLKKSRKAVDFGVMLFVLLLLSFISPMYIVVIITLIIFELFSKKQQLLKLASVFLLVIVSVLGSVVTPMILQHFSMEDFSKGSPSMCNIYVGFNERASGSYNTEDIERLQYVLKTKGLDDTTSNRNEVCKELLGDRLMEYTKEPVRFFQLFAKKNYVNWKGDFHPLEVGASIDRTYNNGNNNLLFWLFTAVSEIIYLLVVSVGFVRLKWLDDEGDSKYLIVCILLGVYSALFFIESMNKYTLHQTILIFAIALWGADTKIRSNQQMTVPNTAFDLESGKRLGNDE